MPGSTEERAPIRFEALDAFRGISAVMIILFHSRFYQSETPIAFFQHAAIFVDFFFILSGFVMMHSYGSRIPGGISFGRFVRLRFARLYPLHLFMLLVWVPFVIAKYYLYAHSGGGHDPADTQNAATFVQNLLLLQGFGATTSWNYPSWSIGVEFYTYLLFFAVMLLAARLHAVAATLLFILLAIGSYSAYDGFTGAFQNMFRSAGEFFLGVLIYRLQQSAPFTPRSHRFADAVELFIMLSVMIAVTSMGETNGIEHLVIALFGAAVYVFAAPGGGIIHRILVTAPLRYLGRISYSVYMTHAIIIIVVYEGLKHLVPWRHGLIATAPNGVVTANAWWINMMLVLVVIAVSAWTYRYVELAAQRYIKKRMERV